MKEYMYDAITNISDDFVEEAMGAKLQVKKSQWQRFGAMAAMLVLLIGIGVKMMPHTAHDGAVAGISLTEGSIEDRSVDSGISAGDEEAAVGTFTEDNSGESDSRIISQKTSSSVILELISWENGGFTATVLDAGENFPVGGELTVIIQGDTEILRPEASADELETEHISWESGSHIKVDYCSYEAYEEGNGFENRLYAQCVSLAD